MLKSIAECGSARNDSHACNNLCKLLCKTARALDMPIATAPVMIRTSKQKQPLRGRIVQYPLLLASDWARCIFRRGGHFFMAGLSLDDVSAVGATLELFWRRYKKLDCHMNFEGDPAFAIPYAIHGDEGRGKGKKPILVLSMQPLVTSPDMSHTNMSGCFGNLSSCKLLNVALGSGYLDKALCRAVFENLYALLHVVLVLPL